MSCWSPSGSASGGGALGLASPARAATSSSAFAGSETRVSQYSVTVVIDINDTMLESSWEEESDGSVDGMFGSVGRGCSEFSGLQKRGKVAITCL